MSEEEKELTEEEKQALEEEKAKAWLTGQKIAKASFIPEAHERAMLEERVKKLEEEMEDLEPEGEGIKSETTKRQKEAQEEA